MSSLQSLREFISERLAAAAEEIFRHCEGTIVQYEQELCRQRRLLDIYWKPQLQLHDIVLPQHYASETEDPSNQPKNSRVKRKEPRPPQIKEEPELPQTEEEWEGPELSQMKEEQEEVCISQDEDQLKFKQQIFMETFSYDDNEDYVLDLKSQQGFSGSDVQTEDGNQNVQNHMPESHSDSDFSEKSNIATLIKKSLQSLKENRLSFMKPCKNSRMWNMNVYKRTESDGRSCICKECGKSFKYRSKLRLHMRVHTGEKPFFCKLCNTRFGQTSSLKRHMMIHTGEKPFPCKECAKSFRRLYHLREHMRTHTEKKTFSYLNAHVKSHTGEAFFL